jgi:hypothetical protein
VKPAIAASRARKIMLHRKGAALILAALLLLISPGERATADQRRMESDLSSQRWRFYITQGLLVNDFRSSGRSLEEADAEFERNAMTD